MTPDNRNIWIQKYVDGKLSATELEAFETQLLSDPQLKTELQQYQKVALLVKEHKLIAIKKMASIAHAKHEKALLWKKVGIMTLLLAVLTASVAVWYLYQSPQTSPPKTSSPLKTTAAATNTPATQKPQEVDKSQRKQAIAISPLAQVVLSSPPALTKDSTPRQTASAPQTDAQLTGPETYSTKTNNANSTKTNKPDSYDCNGTLLSASFDIGASCQNEATGSISYRTVQGGQAPYTAQLYDAQKNAMAMWNELPTGQYHVMLSDAHLCSTWQQLTVDEKACNSHHVFNPHLNETWEIPLKGKKGQLKIVDKKGNLYFSRNLIPSEIAFWDGKSNNGEIKTGYYLFYIQHEDNTLTSGSVTIIE